MFGFVGTVCRPIVKVVYPKVACCRSNSSRSAASAGFLNDDEMLLPIGFDTGNFQRVARQKKTLDVGTRFEMFKVFVFICNDCQPVLSNAQLPRLFSNAIFYDSCDGSVAACQSNFLARLKSVDQFSKACIRFSNRHCDHGNPPKRVKIDIGGSFFAVVSNLLFTAFRPVPARAGTHRYQTAISRFLRPRPSGDPGVPSTRGMRVIAPLTSTLLLALRSPFGRGIEK